MRILFVATIFLGALLLFVVQPLVGKLLLPRLGGAPAVWMTCMMLFQALLLGGYAWAHGLVRIRSLRWQVGLHVATLAAAACLLPVTLRVGAAPQGEGPIGWLVLTLLTAVGLPFFAISANGPLLQRWFAETDDPRAGDPYFLFAASNAGSLLGLLGYPVLMEPWLAIAGQRTCWSIGLLACAMLTLVCGVTAVRRPGPGAAPASAAAAAATSGATPSARDVGRWIAMTFVPSSLMLGVTMHLTTDVAAVPFLWVVPLAIYLGTFIVAFGVRAPRPEPWCRLLVAVTLPTLVFAPAWPHFPIALVLVLHLGILGLGAMMCHMVLAAKRPHPQHLTGFYLAIAAGGALGGVFNALVAPLVFPGVFEYPIAIAAALLLRPRGALGVPRWRVSRWADRVVDVSAVGLAAWVIAASIRVPDLHVVRQQRTFFGVHRVASDPRATFTVYMQGTTLHGIQIASEPRRPLAYYHDDSGIGHLYRDLGRDPRLDRVGVVGLGVGSLAARARPGQHYTFFEIDPVVVDIARDSGLFTFLRDAPQPARIVLGDGRLTLAREPDESFGLLVLDAFSSDAIPVHLLTVEAFELYFSKLQPGGLLAIHITNRHLDLGRLLAGIAGRLGLVAAESSGTPGYKPSYDDGEYESRWVVLARSAGALEPLIGDPAWQPLPIDDNAPVWTDDHSNLLSIVKWWH